MTRQRDIFSKTKEIFKKKRVNNDTNTKINSKKCDGTKGEMAGCNFYNENAAARLFAK